MVQIQSRVQSSLLIRVVVDMDVRSCERNIEPHMSHGLNSLNGGYIEDDMGDY